MCGADAAGRVHTSVGSNWAAIGQEGSQDASGADRSTEPALSCSRKSSADPADGSGGVCCVCMWCIKSLAIAFPSLKPSSYCAPITSVCC